MISYDYNRGEGNMKVTPTPTAGVPVAGGVAPEPRSKSRAGGVGYNTNYPPRQQTYPNNVSTAPAPQASLQMAPQAVPQMTQPIMQQPVQQPMPQVAPQAAPAPAVPQQVPIQQTMPQMAAQTPLPNAFSVAPEPAARMQQAVTQQQVQQQNPMTAQRQSIVMQSQEPVPGLAADPDIYELGAEWAFYQKITKYNNSLLNSSVPGAAITNDIAKDMRLAIYDIQRRTGHSLSDLLGMTNAQPGDLIAARDEVFGVLETYGLHWSNQTDAMEGLNYVNSYSQRSQPNYPISPWDVKHQYRNMAFSDVPSNTAVISTPVWVPMYPNGGLNFSSPTDSDMSLLPSAYGSDHPYPDNPWDTMADILRPAEVASVKSLYGNNRLTYTCAHKAKVVMDFIRSEGYDYSLASKEGRSGQTRIAVGGSRTEISLTNTFGYEDSIGTVKDGTREMRFSIGGRGRDHQIHSVATDDNIRTLLSYGLGIDNRYTSIPMANGNRFTVGAKSGGTYFGEYGKTFVTSIASSSVFEENEAVRARVNRGTGRVIRSIRSQFVAGSGIQPINYDEQDIMAASEFVLGTRETAKQNVMTILNGPTGEDDEPMAIPAYDAIMFNAAESFSSDDDDIDNLVSAVQDKLYDSDFYLWMDQFIPDELAARYYKYEHLAEEYNALLEDKRNDVGDIERVEKEMYQELDAYNEGISEIQQNIFNKILNNETDSPEYKAYMENLPLVKEALEEGVDEFFGSYDERGRQCFDPLRIIHYGTDGTYSQSQYERMMESALRKMNVAPDQITRADDVYVNSKIGDTLIYFDENSSVSLADMQEADHPFAYDAMRSVKIALVTSGCDVKDSDIKIDGQGIISYHATQTDRGNNFMISRRNPSNGKVVRDANGKTIKELAPPISGCIGQVFIPDETGLVHTSFASSEDRNFVPGYQVIIDAPEGEGDTRGVAERTRKLDFRENMRRSIRRAVRKSVFSGSVDRIAPTGINYLYTDAYGTRLPSDWMEWQKNHGFRDDYIQAALKTMTGRGHIGTDFEDNSTTVTSEKDAFGDDMPTEYEITGHRNLRVLDASDEGFWSIEATGTGKTQGINRYDVESSGLTQDGHIAKGDPEDETALMKDRAFRYSKNNAVDRNVMAFNNSLTAFFMDENTHAAHLNIDGWTLDDGYVISKEYADRIRVRSADEFEYDRGLMIQDKMADMNGNKGVVNLIVDRNMSEEEAKKQGIYNVWKLFKDNPELEIVGAPYYGPSRSNAGSALFMMEDPKPLKLPDGRVIEGGMGVTTMQATDMTADTKTHVYSDEDIALGKGRKASAQLAWSMHDKDCPAIMQEFYGHNERAVEDLREYLIACGLDMASDGRLMPHYEEHYGEHRNLISLDNENGDDITYDIIKTENGTINQKQMRDRFINLIEDKGGFFPLPFPLKFPAHDKQGSRDEFPMGEPDINGQPTWNMPIIAPKLRHSRDFRDGQLVAHDYTRHYTKVYLEACKWLEAARAGDAEKMQKAQENAQRSYDRISNDIRATQLDSTKRSFFKNNIMGHRLPHSATAVWSADPRLPIDSVAMSEESMKMLGVHEGDSVLLWRDPQLRDAGVRYLRVLKNDELTGVAVNPVIDKSFDGDFDGDSVGLVALRSAAAKKEAAEKFSVRNCLLDDGVGRDGHHPLLMQDGMDVAAGIAANTINGKPMKEVYEELTARVNREYADKSYLGCTDKTWSDVKAFYKEALNGVGNNVMDYKSPQSVMHSLEAMTKEKGNGAKGKVKGIVAFLKYMGYDYDPQQGTLTPNPLTKEERLALNEDVWIAQAAKTDGTGLAGRTSQRGMRALRNDCPKAISELTYPVTQGTLQSKHSASEAKQKTDLLLNTLTDLYSGARLEPRPDIAKQKGIEYAWRQPKGEGRGQCTPKEFKNQFKEIMSVMLGVDLKDPELIAQANADMGKNQIPGDTPKEKLLELAFSSAGNPDYLDEVAEKLTDPNTGLIMGVDNYAAKHACLLDEMVYGTVADNTMTKGPKKRPMTPFETLWSRAQINENLFNGKCADFRPNNVRNSIDAIVSKGTQRTLEELNEHSYAPQVPNMGTMKGELVNVTSKTENMHMSPTSPIAVSMGEFSTQGNVDTEFAKGLNNISAQPMGNYSKQP